jgi:hypothetical protein
LLKAVVIQAAIGAAISGTIALFTGGNFWEAVGDGFAQGFMWGGIFSTISTAITAIRGAIQGLKYADDVANLVDDTANLTDDAANLADDAATLADDAASGLDDILNSADEINQGSVDIPDHLPEWRKAELRELNRTGGYDQLAFQDGKVVPRKTSGSTRPDVVRVVDNHLEAAEVKYYDLSNKNNRNELYRELLREVTDRCTHLPSGSTQRIVLDVTNRGFDADMVYKIVQNISELLDDIYPNIPIDVVGLL